MKKTSSGAVKACAPLHNEKNDKGSSKENFIKGKVSKTDIYELVNGITAEPPLPVGRLKKKSVENGKHVYSDTNKLTKDAVVVDKQLNNSDDSSGETGSGVRAREPPVSSVAGGRSTGTVHGVAKSNLKKWDSNDNLAKTSIVCTKTDLENLNVVGNENLASPDKPKENLPDKCCEESSVVCDVLTVASEDLHIPTSGDDIGTELTETLDNLHIEEIQQQDSQESCEGKTAIKLSPVEYVQYENELQMPLIMKIIQKDLSEPYSIYTYRYFIHNWPKLCFLAMCEGKCVGAIVCKLDLYRQVIRRGYIAMLAVDRSYRKRGIGSTLVRKAIQEMVQGEADEVVLETEITNRPALQLYEALGFVRDKRLFRYYLNGVDALRLKLWLR